MTYKTIRMIWEDNLSRHIMKYINPTDSLVNQTQVSALEFYITFIVPTVRKTQKHWRYYTLLNPLAITWLINSEKLERDNSNEPRETAGGMTI